MNDIEKPFGLLPEKTRKELMLLPPAQVEFYGMSGWTQMEERTPWLDTVTYRAKRKLRRYWIRDGQAHDAPVDGGIEVIEAPK